MCFSYGCDQKPNHLPHGRPFAVLHDQASLSATKASDVVDGSRPALPLVTKAGGTMADFEDHVSGCRLARRTGRRRHAAANQGGSGRRGGCRRRNEQVGHTKHTQPWAATWYGRWWFGRMDRVGVVWSWFVPGSVAGPDPTPKDGTGSDHRPPRRRNDSQTDKNCRCCPGCGWTAQIDDSVARTNREGRCWPQRTHWPRWSRKAPVWRALMMPFDQRSMVGRYRIRWTRSHKPLYVSTPLFQDLDRRPVNIG